MSSVVAFVRALVMLACVLMVLVLAVSHGEAISRVTHAAAECLDRVASDQRQGSEDSPAMAELAEVATATRREAVPVGGTSAEPAGGAGPARDRRLTPLPEPVDEKVSQARFTPALVRPSAPDRLQHGEPAAIRPHVPKVAPEAHESSAADWQERASVLQQLGAVEYALEKWGRTGELYRFRCLVALAGSRSYQKHFQAVDRDGGRAVERVVEQVGSWRARLSGLE